MKHAAARASPPKEEPMLEKRSSSRMVEARVERMDIARDNRPQWLRNLGDQHFEGCHVNWQSDGICICDKIERSTLP